MSLFKQGLLRLIVASASIMMVWAIVILMVAALVTIFSDEDEQVVSSDQDSGIVFASAPGGACDARQIENLKSQLVAFLPGAAVREIEPQPYLALFDAIPPASVTPPPDKLFIVEGSAQPLVMVASVYSGPCQIRIAYLKRDHHLRIIAQIESDI